MILSIYFLLKFGNIYKYVFIALVWYKEIIIKYVYFYFGIKLCLYLIMCNYLVIDRWKWKIFILSNMNMSNQIIVDMISKWLLSFVEKHIYY